MHSTTTDQPAKKPGLLINRNYALLWTGATVSIFGDVIFDFTLAVWIALFLGKGQAWAPLAASGVGLAVLVPTFLFGPVAGVFVDRWDKRRTMLRMDLLRAIMVGILILATNVIPLPFLPDGRVPLIGQLSAIYAVVFINSLFSQFFAPAKTALIGDIVPRESQPKAGGLAQVTQSISMLLAPPIAPILALAFGVQWALLIDALTFVVSFLMVQGITAPPAARSVAANAKGNFLREFFTGLRFAAQNKFVASLIIGASVIMFGAASLNTLDVFFVIQNLHAQAQIYGFLSTAMGVGIILGAILSTSFAQRIGLVRTLNISLLCTALAILAYSRMTSYVPALICIFIAGIFQAALNSVVGPLVLRVTPRELIGRVSGVLNPAVAMAQMLGTIIAGYLASNVLADFHQSFLGQTFGQIDTIFTGGAVIALLGVLYSLLRLGFRDPPAFTGPGKQEPPRESAPEAPALSAAVVAE